MLIPRDVLWERGVWELKARRKNQLQWEDEGVKSVP